MAAKKLWKRVEDLENRPHLREEDECYYAQDYISHGGFLASPCNNRISNFKKPPSVKGTPQWAYKQSAIQDFAADLKLVIGAKATVAAIPTSKPDSDPEYDSRLDDTLESLQKHFPNVKIVKPFLRHRSSRPAHKGGPRDPELIKSELKCQLVILAECNAIVLVDDVLTTGCHFRACKDLVRENYPSMMVYGVFWARTVNNGIDFDVLLNR